MTVTATPRIAGPYATNGAQTTFPFAFKVFTADDVAVILTVADAALDTGTTLGVADYSVALNADQDVSPGGTITTTTAYASGNEITITSSLALEMQTVFSNQGGFYPRVLNDVHDRIVMMIQQIASGVLIGLQGPPGPPGEAGDGAGDSETLMHAPYTNSLLIGSIAGNVLTVNAAIMEQLTPLGSYGLPEVGQKLTRLLGGLPDGIEIVAQTTPLIIPTQNGVYTLSEAVSPALPGVNYFLANKRLTEEERPLAKVYSDKQSVADWGTTGQNDSGDEAKLIKAFAEKRIGSDIFIPAGEYTLTDTLLHNRDGNIIMEHGTRLNLRVAAGNAVSALKVDQRYSRVASENRGQGIYGNGGGVMVYNTSSGGSADTYDVLGNRTEAKAGAYAIEIDTTNAVGTTQQVIRYTIDNVVMRGGINGALHLKGGNPGVNAYPEVYWVLVQNCPSIEGAIVDECSDGCAYRHNNFIGSWQPAMIWNKIQGAFNNLAANNTSSCRRGFLAVQNGSMFTIQENQIELAGPLANDSAFKAAITISATDYPCFLPRFIGNNFGTGALNDVAVALTGEVIGPVFDANYWNLYGYTPGGRYDLVLGPNVRDIVWLPTNQFRGLRIGAAAVTRANLAALKAGAVTGGGAVLDVNYDNSRWFYFTGDQSATPADDINYVLADGQPITSGLWKRSIVDIGSTRRPIGTVTDPTRMLRVGWTGGASEANVKSHTGLRLPIGPQLTMLNGAVIDVATGIEVIRDSTGIWEAFGNLSTVHLTADVFTLPDWARGVFQQNVRPISNGAVVPRALTTGGTLAGGTAFGAASASLDGVRWQGLSNYDYDLGP